MVRYLIGASTGWKTPTRRNDCLRTWIADCDLLCIPSVLLFGAEKLSTPELHGHALLLPCPDSYETLPQRTRWFCRWALERNDWDYLFKCDDDTYIAAIRLMEYYPKGEYVGSDFGSFCSGGAGYLLSRRCVQIIAEHMTITHGAEDVMVGGLLRASRVPLTNDERFVAYGKENERPTAYNNIITAHHITSEMFNKIHAEVGIKTKFRI
jgi:hypothetical protein